MIGRAVVSSVLLFLALIPVACAQDGKFSIKLADTAPPKELGEAVQQALQARSVQLLDPSGKVVCELWFRKELPAEATLEQIKNGLTYREVKQSELFGAIKFEQEWRDYRKQKVKAGVYTLRLGYQPMDGDHTGSSEFQDFLVILAAAKDTKPQTLDPKHMVETSMKSIGTGHPGVFMLFPTSKPGAAPALAAMPKNHWVLQTKSDIVVGGKKTGTSLGIGLALVGAAD